MNLRALLYILGWLVLAFGGFMLVPVVVTTNSFYIGHFAECASITVFSGACLLLMNRTSNSQLTHRDGFLLTALTWTVLSIFGALPLYITGITQSFVPAFFEAVSGLTTTGATVLTGLDSMDKSILLWRQMLQWLGGMGIVVLAIAILPFLQVGGMQLYKSEMAGVTKDKLHPRLQDTAKTLWIVYVGLTILCAIAYGMAGMGTFDAVAHAMSTVATGGYSPHDASIGHFNSFWVEVVAIVFMLAGSINFALHYIALSGRRLKGYFANEECRAFLLAILVFVGLNAFLLNFFQASDTPLRHSLFNTVAVITTTGYATTDYGAWPVALQVVLFFLMFAGGCSGSTTGGVKNLRLLVLTRQGGRELFRLIHPRSVVSLKIDGLRVPERVLYAVWSFVVLYAATFILVAFVISLFGFDFLTSFAAAGATLTGLGPGFGMVGPASHYAMMPEGAQLVLCLSMLLGRLEIFTLLVLLVPAFWKR